ncbi:hypothetical protein ACK2SD_01095 [Pseudomonas sp. SC11]|uniref:hypothetical protein n=1 Tax=Pseudomonas sp. SC11 TaxID=326927 RepID=UPI00399B7174
MKHKEKHRRKTRKGKYKKSVFSILQALSGAGLLGIIVATSYKFLISDPKLTFEKPHGRSYIFSLNNDSPADIVVKKFEISYPAQPVIAKTTRAIYGEMRNGKAVIPGGNTSTVPIIEFHELDGETISAGENHRFRLPPLNSRDYLQLEAAVFDIAYEVEPRNKALSIIDATLKRMALRNRAEEIRYVVVDNYWVPTRAKSVHEAIRIACRDNDMLSRDLCAN